MLYPEPITAYLGVNGSGKTLSAVAFAVSDYRRQGRPLPASMCRSRTWNSCQSCSLRSAAATSCWMRSARCSRPARRAATRRFRPPANSCGSITPECCGPRRRSLAPRRSAARSPSRRSSARGSTSGACPGTRGPLHGWCCRKSSMCPGSTRPAKNAKAKGFGLVVTRRWQDEFDSFAVATRGTRASGTRAA